LEIALGINGAGLPRLEPTGTIPNAFKVHPIPSQWKILVNDSLRLESVSHGNLFGRIACDRVRSKSFLKGNIVTTCVSQG
jgi:hypothetical protein